MWGTRDGNTCPLPLSCYSESLGAGSLSVQTKSPRRPISCRASQAMHEDGLLTTDRFRKYSSVPLDPLAPMDK